MREPTDGTTGHLGFHTHVTDKIVGGGSAYHEDFPAEVLEVVRSLIVSILDGATSVLEKLRLTGELGREGERI